MNDPVSSSPSLTTNVQLRIGLLFVLLVSSAVSTALPVLLSLKFSKSVKKDSPLWRKLLLSSLNCFAGGVFLGVTFLHLLPDLSRSWGIILSDVWPSDYPFNNFLVVLGFFLILVIEQIAHTCQYKKETVVETSEKPHSEQQVAIKRYRSQPNILASLQNVTAEEHVLSLKYHSDCNVCEREHKKHYKGSSSSPIKGHLVYARRAGELPNDPRLHEQSPSNGNHQQNTEEINGTTALVSSAEHQYGSPFTSPDHKNSENKPVNTPSGSQSTLRALFLAVALSVHSVFEGLAFGLIKNDAEAAQLFVGIVIHKTVIGLSLGIAFVTSQSKIWLSLVLTFIFVMSSPVGIAVGLGIRTHPGDNTGSLITSAILEALACGTFAYITFLELIGHEFSNIQSAIARHRLGLVLCSILGFSLIAGLTFLPG